MTVEEKRTKMEAACEGYSPFCYSNGGCPLYKNCPDCTCCDFDDDDFVEGYYEVLCGNETDNPVTHPSHYTQGNIQCIDAMESAFGKEAVATWCKLNAFKYIWREQHKNRLQDIDKAIWYLNKYKELSVQ